MIIQQFIQPAVISIFTRFLSCVGIYVSFVAISICIHDAYELKRKQKKKPSKT